MRVKRLWLYFRLCHSCVTLGKALHLPMPLFPSLFMYSRVLWGRNSLLEVCTGLWFPFWALGTKNKYSHTKYFIVQCWKLFIFDGSKPIDSGYILLPSLHWLLFLSHVSREYSIRTSHKQHSPANIHSLPIKRKR